MWQDIRRDVLEVIRLEKEPPTIDALIDDHMPKWFGSYVLYKFNLYDRAGESKAVIKTEIINIKGSQILSIVVHFSANTMYTEPLVYQPLSL